MAAAAPAAATTMTTTTTSPEAGIELSPQPAYQEVSRQVGENLINDTHVETTFTAKFFGIARFNMEEETGRGIVIALVQTNSTGRLAPLDGMILAGQGEFSPEGTSTTTLWEWQSGIPLPTSTTTGAEETPQMNTTMMSTTTTTAADTNATTTTTEEEEEEEEVTTTPEEPLDN